MNLLTRVKDIVAADLHSLLDEKEKKNPTAMLNQLLRNCEKEVEKVEALIKRQGALKAKFYEEKEHAAYMMKKREHQAEVAMKANETELEKRAHEEAVYYKAQAMKLDDLYEKAKNDAFALQNQLQDMRNKLKEMYHRRWELMGRENVAHANQSIKTSMSDLSAEGPLSYFSTVEKQIERLEEVIHMAYERTTFDTKMAQLERELALKNEKSE
ncbi:MAG: PspA/IM30 family protein [Defluviitaleaceae bacterium]|nr:PspA/IM30 family protein [Defluviitaleaceae bacterium]